METQERKDEAVPLKLSMWTSYYIDLAPEDALVEIAAAGWEYAELSDEHSRALLERGRPSDVGRAYRRFADGCGVRVTQGHLDLPADIAPADETARRAAVETLRYWLDLYLAIGIRAAVLHPGGRKHTEIAARTDEQLRSLEELSEQTRTTDLVICIENCTSGDAIKPILARTDPLRVGACLDTGHLNLTDESQIAFIRHCGSRLRALHLAENDKSGDQHTMPFAKGGCVPWQEIAGALREIGYAGLLNYEVPGERLCPVPVRRLKLDYLKAVSAFVFQ